MEILLVNVDDSSDMELLLTLARKLGLSARKLSKRQVEDWSLAQEIKQGMKTKNVSREQVMKALGK